MSNLPLRNRRVLVTGGTRGIGLAAAELLHTRGARLALVGRDVAQLEAAVPSAPDTLRIQADLGTDSGLDAVTEALAGQDLYAVVHSAGACILGSVETTEAAAFDVQWMVNLRAPYLLTGRLLPALRATQGHVVFINSGAGRRANPGWSAYAATKFGLSALAESLRAEVSGDGIRVTTVFPGRTATEMQQGVKMAEGKSYDPTALVRPSDVAAGVVSALELQPPSVMEELSIRPV